MARFAALSALLRIQMSFLPLLSREDAAQRFRDHDLVPSPLPTVEELQHIDNDELIALGLHLCRLGEEVARRLLMQGQSGLQSRRWATVQSTCSSVIESNRKKLDQLNGTLRRSHSWLAWRSSSAPTLDRRLIGITLHW